MKILKYLCVALLFFSCSEEWLDIKSNKSFIVPTKIHELQSLLDNTNIMNHNVMSTLLEVSTDNVELTEAQWKAKAVQLRNAYVWSADIDEGLTSIYWSYYYGQIYYANTVLEGIQKSYSGKEGDNDVRNVLGQALFYRAWAHFNLLQLYAKQYDETSKETDLAIPLKKESVLDQPSTRVTVKEAYDFLLQDLGTAKTLLPDEPLVKSRPSKHACYAFYARLYLQLGNYGQAKAYADSALAIKGELMDYRTLNPASSYPFNQFNEEVIFYQVMSVPSFFVNNEFYKTYGQDDLRRVLFFRSSGSQIAFKGSYSSASNFFAGLATDEIMLIRAECNARLSNYEMARQDMRQLLEKRYASAPTIMEDNNLLIDYILTERRKQLLYRGLRWLDLRRLNTDKNRMTTLERQVGDNKYNLGPNSPRYVFPIPVDVIKLNPEMPQNQR